MSHFGFDHPVIGSEDNGHSHFDLNLPVIGTKTIREGSASPCQGAPHKQIRGLAGAASIRGVGFGLQLWGLPASSAITDRRRSVNVLPPPDIIREEDSLQKDDLFQWGTVWLGPIRVPSVLGGIARGFFKKRTEPSRSFKGKATTTYPFKSSHPFGHPGSRSLSHSVRPYPKRSPPA